jgi:hypothetical protein
MRKLARSTPEQPGISQRHAHDMRAALEKHILTTFKNCRLSNIKVSTIERWMFDLQDKGLSAKRVNNVSSCLPVMLREAHRNGDAKARDRYSFGAGLVGPDVT